MLSEWQKNAKKYIPKQIPGYDFICRIPVYIPIREINMIVWERRIQQLSFIHECMLSSISLSPKTVSGLSVEFGLPEDIIVQIIAQLDTEQLAAVSSGTIIITNKGKETLKSQKQTKIVRNQFSGIFVNQVTGDISDFAPVGTYPEPPRGTVYLEEVFAVDLDFLRARFSELSIKYKDNRMDSYLLRNSIVDSVELYRILEVSYNKLSYLKDYCFVYLNQDDLSFNFLFQSGIHAYSESMLQQINSRTNGTQNLLLHPYHYCEEVVTDDLPVRLIEAFQSNINPTEQAELIEKEYYQNRPLLDGEVEDILCNLNLFRAERIYIQTPYLTEFFNDDVIASILSPFLKELTIKAIEDSAPNKRILERIKNATKKRKGFKMNVLPATRETATQFIIGDQCKIVVQYSQFETNYHRKIYKPHASISFDKSAIQNQWTMIKS